MRKTLPTAVIAAAAFLIISTSAYPQAEALMIGLCRKITDDPARLKCYDAIGGTTDGKESKQQAATPRPKEEWTINETKSPVDDSPQIAAGLMSEDGRSSIILRCFDRKTDAVVMPGNLFAYERGTVLMRLNELPAVTATWVASSDNRALFAPNGVSFVKMLPDDGTLFIRATGHSRRADDATFKLGNVSAIRDKIASACNWTDATSPKAAAAPQKRSKSNDAPVPLKAN